MSSCQTGRTLKSYANESHASEIEYIWPDESKTNTNSNAASMHQHVAQVISEVKSQIISDAESNEKKIIGH